MKFQKFPVLVQEQIMKDLSYEDLFCLSLTSTRFVKIIRCLKLVKVSKVRYVQKSNGFDIHIEEHQNNKLFPLGSVKIQRSRNFKYLFTTRLGTDKVNFECQTNDCPQFEFKNVLFCRDDFEQIIPKAMVEHTNNLFGQPPVVALCVDFDASLDVRPVVSSVTELEFVSNKKINARCVEFIKNNPNLKYLSIDGHWKVEPDFPDTSYLKMDYSDHWTNSILRNFKGKHLELGKAKLSREEILEFIRKWKANEGYHNYECIDIKTKEFIHQSEEAMREIESADWNPDERPGIYEYCCPANHKRKMRTFYFQDIRRNGDNQLASFYIWPKNFLFVVWK